MSYLNPDQAIETEHPPEPEAEGGAIAASGSPWQLVLRTFAQNKLAVVGLVLIVVMILFSFLGPAIYHSNQSIVDQAGPDLHPGGSFPLGTDNNGFDVFGRLMLGGQSSIEVGFAVGLVSTLIGLIYGAVSGYFGGWIDAAMMRFVDIALAVPVVVLLVFASVVFSPNVLLLIFMLTILSWMIPARLVRGEALTLRTREYVQAVRGMGGTSGRIIFKHLVPNTIGTIVVTVTFQIANAILVLAVLQYLGFGLPSTTATWGGMLSQASDFMQDGYWWQVYPPLVCIIIVVVAFNLVGDALQDAFDVRLQER